MANYELKTEQFEKLMETLGSKYIIASEGTGHVGPSDLAPFVTAYIVKGENEAEHEKIAKSAILLKEKSRATVQMYYYPISSKNEPTLPTLYVILGKNLSSEIQKAIVDLGIKPVVEKKEVKKPLLLTGG